MIAEAFAEAARGRQVSVFQRGGIRIVPHRAGHPVSRGGSSKRGAAAQAERGRYLVDVRPNVGRIGGRGPRMLPAAGSLLCGAIAFRFAAALDGTEFSGGRITGPLLSSQGFGCELFLVAAVLTFFLSRLAGLLVFLACILSMPLYLLFLAPGPFRWVVGVWETYLTSSFVWHSWSFAGILSCCLAALLALACNLRPPRRTVVSWAKWRNRDSS